MALSDIPPAAGVVLIAPPMMQDPNFRRTVILLCEHGVDGSFGLILNKAISMQLADVVEDMDQYTGPLSVGGPVQPDTLHVLHRFGQKIGDAVEINNDLYWGGDFDEIQKIVRTQQTSQEDIRFFLGYAGWSPGQLDAEIEQDGWIVTPVLNSFVFEDKPDDLWKNVLRKMGGEYALLSNFPEDPRMN